MFHVSFRKPTVSLLGTVWRPQSVNIEGGLWWDSYLFGFFCFPHTTEGQCACLHGTESDFFVLFVSEQSWGEHNITHLLFARHRILSQSTQEVAAFPSPSWFKYTCYTRALGGFLFALLLLFFFKLTHQQPLSCTHMGSEQPLSLEKGTEVPCSVWRTMVHPGMLGTWRF